MHSLAPSFDLWSRFDFRNRLQQSHPLSTILQACLEIVFLYPYRPRQPTCTRCRRELICIGLPCGHRYSHTSSHCMCAKMISQDGINASESSHFCAFPRQVQWGALTALFLASTAHAQAVLPGLGGSGSFPGQPLAHHALGSAIEVFAPIAPASSPSAATPTPAANAAAPQGSAPEQLAAAPAPSALELNASDLSSAQGIYSAPTPAPSAAHPSEHNVQVERGLFEVRQAPGSCSAYYEVRRIDLAAPNLAPVAAPTGGNAFYSTAGVYAPQAAPAPAPYAAVFPVAYGAAPAPAPQLSITSHPQSLGTYGAAPVPAPQPAASVPAPQPTAGAAAPAPQPIASPAGAYAPAPQPSAGAYIPATPAPAPAPQLSMTGRPLSAGSYGPSYAPAPQPSAAAPHNAAAVPAPAVQPYVAAVPVPSAAEPHAASTVPTQAPALAVAPAPAPVSAAAVAPAPAPVPAAYFGGYGGYGGYGYAPGPAAALQAYAPVLREYPGAPVLAPAGLALIGSAAPVMAPANAPGEGLSWQCCCLQNSSCLARTDASQRGDCFTLPGLVSSRTAVTQLQLPYLLRQRQCPHQQPTAHSLRHPYTDRHQPHTLRSLPERRCRTTAPVSA